MKASLFTTLLFLCFAALCLSACSLNPGGTDGGHELFDKVCPAGEALELCKNDDVVVIEDMRCTSGREVWDAFYRTTQAGKKASVLCAHYYTIDKEHMSEELYEEEKDKYPALYFMLVKYDGKRYTVTTRDCSLETPEPSQSYKYLMHYTGSAPTPYAVYSTYDRYVLTDSSGYSWEDIERGMYSSRLGDYIRHCSVYTDLE